jgi:hypothetical protein
LVIAEGHASIATASARLIPLDYDLNRCHRRANVFS